MLYSNQIRGLWEGARHSLTDVLPSDWAEGHMRVTEGKYPGPLSYDRTPFSREIIDCMSPHHPANNVVVMGGSQWGKTRSIIEPLIAWLIAQHPCNIGYLTGHSELSEESMQKLESALENTKLDDGRLLREILRNASMKKRNLRTGDTAKKKEFPGGTLISGSATNHKLLRQYNWKVIIADDVEAAKKASKESGDTVGMITHRAASYGDDKKILWVSTPELKLTSIIERLYLKGDQRRWLIPCQVCHKHIPLNWNVEIPGKKERAGMWWKTDPDTHKLIRSSVGYVCQECGNLFTDRNKKQFLLDGFWRPTVVADTDKWVSFHLSTLYAMPGANNWADYVQQFLDANPKDRPQDEHLHKTFVNLVLGETYEPVNESPRADSIQKNRRNYAPCVLQSGERGAGSGPHVIPNRLSLADGNGNIILLTCAADMNGTVDDARLDWEILAHAESGATYSIAHGSIGTFIPRENALKTKVDRERLTYEDFKSNSVWGEFDKVLETVFVTDDVPVGSGSTKAHHDSSAKGRKMGISIAGLDTGKHTVLAYQYIDRTNNFVVALKGDGEDKYLKFGLDVRWFKKGLERVGLYVLQVGLYKDRLADFMQLNWNPNEESQPDGFMNYPTSEGGLYQWDNYYEHYQSEHRTTVTDTKGNLLYRWVKKQSNSQNHMFDCRVYNLAVKDIWLQYVGENMDPKIRDFTWGDYVRLVRG